MLMAEYYSKYYNPDKAHEYYLRIRELKGYEDRYGGHRGFGTSAASNPGLFANIEKELTKDKTKSQEYVSVNKTSSTTGSIKKTRVEKVLEQIKQSRSSTTKKASKYDTEITNLRNKIKTLRLNTTTSINKIQQKIEKSKEEYEKQSTKVKNDILTIRNNLVNYNINSKKNNIELRTNIAKMGNEFKQFNYETRSEINKLRYELQEMSPEERKVKRQSYRNEMERLRRTIHDKREEKRNRR